MTLYDRLLTDSFKNNVPYTGRTTSQDYYVRWRQLNALFKQEALKEAGLADHPNADRIFDMAWSRGHSSGFAEVLGELHDLAGLFEPKDGKPIYVTEEVAVELFESEKVAGWCDQRCLPTEILHQLKTQFPNVAKRYQ